MSLPLAVKRQRPCWAPWRSVDLDGWAVLAALGPLFASAGGRSASGADGDPGRRPYPAGDLGTSGRRRGAVLAGAPPRIAVGGVRGDRGVREVDVDVWDDFPDRSLDEFAAELRLLLAPLHGLAKAGGARLLADTGDVTDRPLDEIIDLVA